MTPQTLAARPDRPRRLEALDLLRFMAAVSVVLYHYLFRGWQNNEFFSVRFDRGGEDFRYGYLGVELFFVISGFVIPLSCDGRSPREFVQSRITRLYPAYVLAVLLTWGVTSLFGSRTLHFSIVEMLVKLTMFQQFLGVRNVDGVYWTLTRELLFYVFIYLCLWRGWARRIEVPLAIWTLWSFAAPLLRLGKVAIVLTNADYSGYFIAGSTLFLLYRRGRSAFRLALLGGALALMHLQAAWKADRLIEATGHAHPWWLLVLINSAMVAGVAVLVFKEFRLWGGAVSAEIGAMTYPLYLLHAHLGYVALSRASDATKWFVATGTFAAVLLLSWFIVRYWERPLQRRIRALFARSADRPPVLAT